MGGEALNEGRPREERRAGEPPPEIATPPKPLLPAWARFLLYLAACLMAGCIGLVLGGLVAALWLFGKYGPQAMQRLHQEIGAIVLACSFAIYPLLILVTVLFVWFVDRRPLSSVGLTKERWLKDLAIGVGIGVGFVVAMAVLYRLAGWLRFEPAPISIGMWLVTTLLLYPLIGFAEELVFRGYLLSTLEEWGGRKVAMAVTAVLFWMLHIGYGTGSPVNELIAIPTYLAVGVTFALCRYSVGNLWLPIGLHTAYNWAAFSLMGSPKEIGFPSFFTTEPTVPHWLVGPPGKAGLIDMGVTFLFLAAIYFALYRPSLRRQVTNR
ncbi:MAG: CPBP family intramembrane glutamic endopeptidase [Armatimonadota bacterium]|nr:CPBP family intramembrane glutamic endopeptidase [Armatimonadota bacterium]